MMDHFYILHLLFAVFMSTCYTSPNYGRFQLMVTKMELCAGPRNKNCSLLDTSRTIFNNGNVDVTFKVLEDVSPTKGKILAMSNGKELVRLQMNKPCEHLFLRPLLESMFKVSKGCKISKGEYYIKINMQEMMETYFGGKFFYGNISFRALFYGNDCNFSCTNTFLTVSPKN